MQPLHVLDHRHSYRIALIPLYVGAIGFFGIFEQAPTTLNTFAINYTADDLAGLTIPKAWYQSVNGFFIVALAHPAASQDRLSAARDLYSSASYEEALAALTTIAASAPQEVALEAHQYRAFSLFALGRTAEAEQVAEMSIRLNPLGKVSDAETSPRIASMFTAVRKRVLPALIRDEYRVARAAIDRKDLKAAEPHLTLASRLLAEVKSMGIADDTLSDLSLVIDGFLGLSRAAEQPPVAKPPVQPPAGPLAATGTPPTSTEAMNFGTAMLQRETGLQTR